MKTKNKIGDLIKVPIGNNMHTYARIIVDNSYAFYDCRTSLEIKDFSIILNSEILFFCYVYHLSIEQGGWEKIINLPLEKSLENFYPRYFNPSPTRVENINFYNVYKDEIENAISKDWIKTGKIQLDGIYNFEHVIARINDYYNGNLNENNTNLINSFKKLAKL
jgi:Immunity protein 26